MRYRIAIFKRIRIFIFKSRKIFLTRWLIAINGRKKARVVRAER